MIRRANVPHLAATSAIWLGAVAQLTHGAHGAQGGTGRVAREPRSVDPAPNVIVVVADDLGTDLLEVYEPFYPGTPTVPPPPPTPAIDWLASGGMVFTDFWTSPVCTPTRAQLLTGRMPSRTGLGGLGFWTNPEPGLQLSERTLPQFLHKVTPPYFSAGLGKWHVASTNDLADWNHALGPPDDPWFDMWAGALFNLSAGEGVDYNSWEKTFATPVDPVMDEYRAPRRFPGRVLLDEDSTSSNSPGHYATVDTIDDAVHLVGTLPEPFFLYVAFAAPHIPPTDPPAPLSTSSCRGLTTDPTCSFTGSSRSERIRCMTQWMDNELGRLLCDVDDEGLAPRTVVFFLGDNGTLGDKSTILGGTIPGVIEEPFDADHGKGTVYQGGVNAPLIVRGPGVVPGVSHALVCATDLLATVMDLAGAPAPDELTQDSVSFAPVLRGERDSVRKSVMAELFSPNFAPEGSAPPAGFVPQRHARTIRNARYKLIRRERFNNQGQFVMTEELFELGRDARSGLQADPFEQIDLRDRVTPGGTSPLDRAYRELLDELQADLPSLYDSQP